MTLLLLLLAHQEPLPPEPPPEKPPVVVEEPPQAPNPPPPEFPPPAPEERGVLLPTPTPTAPAAAAAGGDYDFFAADQPGHYLAWYGAEYVAVATLAGVYFSGIHKTIEPAPALIGPQFDLDKPDLELLFDPRLDATIGQPLLREKVPNELLIGGIAGTALVMTGADYLATTDLHRTHALVLGSLETVFATVAVTEVTKLTFGRLRPDFRARYVAAACNDVVDKPSGLDCSQAGASDVAVDKEELLDGMKSFMSGHSSSSFAMATFTSLWLGSSLVWNDDAPAWGPAVGALGIGTLYTAAAVTAATRLDDHRHHAEDVAAGAGVGAAIGAAVFFVHFDVDGKARHRSWTIVPIAGDGGNGAAVAGVF